MSKEQEHIEKIRKEKFWLDKKGLLREKNPLIDDLMNSIERLSEGLYSKDTHFIFELIQNAEDNTYNEADPSLSFQLVKNDPTSTQNATGALIIQNNEVGFSPDNVDAICAIGKTTKSKIRGYIGEKGIGFKSVFRITTVPYIFSNGYQFCFPEKDEETGLGYIVPRWVKNIPPEIDPGQTTIILPLDRRDYGYKIIKKMLRDIEPETILFLSKLKEIQIGTEAGDDLTILKDDTKNPRVQISIEGKKPGKSFSKLNEFLLYTKTVDKPEDVNHEKRIGIDKRDISIAFPIDDKKESAGKIFAYLPVRSDTGLPFLINADFILPSSREDIQDVPWNKWLMDCVANLLATALPLLKEKGFLSVALLEKLASRMNELAEDEDGMFYPIVEAVYNSLMDKELLPADDGTFVSAPCAELARGADMRELLNQNQLKSLFQSNDEIKWLSREITQDLTPGLHTYLSNEIHVEMITPVGFARKVTNSFFERQSNQWMISFYKFLNGQEALWKNRYSPLWNKSFIRLHDGAHVSPFNEDNSPNAYLPLDGDTEFPVVEPQISNDENALEFLKRLGLTEPDTVAEVIEKIIPKYCQGNCQISSDEHQRDMIKILRAYSTDSQEKKQLLVNKLKETPFVYAENTVLHKLAYKEADCLYLRNDDLLMYFDGNEDAWFVSSEYDKSFYDLFKYIGVGDIIEVELKQPSLWNSYVVITGYWGCHQRGLNKFDPDIEVDGLEYALQNPTMERSLLVWRHITSPYSYCIRGVVESSTRQTYEDSSKKERVSRFGRLLMDNAWLPGSDGIFHKPGELGLDDLPETFHRDEKLSEKLGMKKDVVARLAAEAGVPAEDIELLKQHPEEFKQWKSTIAAQKHKPTFPERASSNAERRQAKLAEQLDDTPNKEYEQRDRSVRTTEVSERVLWLRNQYTNADGQMICQVCKEEMPFRKRDGEYYFEAVEALSKDHFTIEHEAQFLALCPLCAAMYKEFVKRDEEAMVAMKNALINADDFVVPLRLGELDTSIRFVETHYHDIKTIIEASR